jgi:hypothetical protein
MPPPVALFAPRAFFQRLLNRSTFTFVGIMLVSISFIFLAVPDKAFGDGMSGGNFDGPAELPRVYVQSALADTPAPGHTIRVSAVGDFQGALNNASCGDTIELQAGATFPGIFTLPAKPCDDQHWIYIRTSAPDDALPPEGIRLTPCYAGVASLPGRPDFHCTSTANVMAKLVLVKRSSSGPLSLAPGANHYRLIGLEITRLYGIGPAIDLILAQGMADHIVLDRVWVHGNAQEETRRGILLSGITTVAVVDSYFSDFHCTSLSGSCTDSQAIAGGSSTFVQGPYKIVDNFLEAAAEGILLGGGSSLTTPADIEIRRNHFFKPMIWQPGQPGFVGSAKGDPFVVKNHFELKNAQRVLFEGNILENTWGGFTQHGFSIVLTPKGHTAPGSLVNLCAICQVTDVTIRFNTMSHMGSGIEISTALTKGDGLGVPAMAGARFSIHDVVLDDIDATRYVGHGSLLHLSNGWSRNVLNQVTISHVTAFPEIYLITLENRTSNQEMTGFVFTNNIVGSGKYPIFSAGGGPTNCAKSGSPKDNLSHCFAAYTFKSNVIVGASSAFPPSVWPAGNHFAGNVKTLDFLNYSDGDYSLLPSSPYWNTATDGTNPGADVEAVETAISGVY